MWCRVLNINIQTVFSVDVWSTFVINMLHDTIMTSVDMEHLQPLSRTHQYRKVSACFVFILPICSAFVRPSELCRVIAREIMFACIWPFYHSYSLLCFVWKASVTSASAGKVFVVRYILYRHLLLHHFNFQLLILLRTFSFKVIVSVFIYVRVWTYKTFWL